MSAGLWLYPADAAAQGSLSVQIVNGYNLIVDSNVTAPPTYAPKSAYIGAQFCNTGNAALADVIAYTGNYNGGVGSTPGIFPSRTFVGGDPQTQLIGTGSYALAIEAGQTGAPDGTRYIGTLGPGECRVQYWLFSYPQCVNLAGGVPQAPPCDASITGDVKPTNDPVLFYDVWATTSTGGVATASSRRSFTMRNEISASANKIWPNNAAKVPDEYLTAIQSVVGWGTLGPDGQPLTTSNPVYPGQRLITTQGIWYDLGNVGQGFDNNGDLVPDQNAWLQPVGDPGKFDADCFRLVNVYGIVIVKLKTGGELLVPFVNRLYFENTPDNTGVVGLVFYQFIATDQGCSAAMTPYQEAASGFDNEKFSADYGLSLGLLSGSFGANLGFTKSDTVSSVAPLGSLTYTLSVPTNTTGVNLGAPDLGTPLVFREQIPAGLTYVSASAAAGLTPPAGAGSYSQGYTDNKGTLDTCTINYTITSSSYTILYSTNNGSTWSLTDPGSSVTDIQWMLFTTIALDGGHNGADCIAPDGAYDNGTIQTSLPAGKTTSMTFQVTVAATAGPVLCNTATLGFGPATSSKTAQDCDIVTGNNSLSGTVFEDDGGVGGIYGNGTIDNATEVGIGAGVTVTLYYDVDGNGKYSTGDLQYATTTTSSTGTYSFSSLPDGPYVVVINKYDGTTDGNAATEFLASRAANANDTTGWGNTTYDPNLPLTTNQGILALNENLNTVSLAVNIDLAKSNATGQSITGVNFGFAPPFRLTKVVTNNPDLVAPADVADTTIDEGSQFSYSILLENRLPSVGRQTPTGCEYVSWATTGLTGGNPKDFSSPGNAYDSTSPNGAVATATVTGGGLRWIWGSTLNLAPHAGTITKVEALYFAYFNVPLTDDFLNLTVGLAAAGSGSGGLTGTLSTATIPTAQIDSYVGAPANFDPNNAIPWDISSARPGGGAWGWSDFPGIKVQVNPSKTASADAKIFSLDAIGLRVTTDAACEASPSTTLDPVPLQDRYDIGSIEFVSADPAPTSVNTTTGVLQWTDVGPILPGSSKVVTVTARAKNVTGLQSGACAAFTPPGTVPPDQPPAWSTGSPTSKNCNYAQTAYSTYNVKYADGRLANDDYDKMAISIQGKAELHGIVYNDNVAPTGWPITTDSRLPNVTLTLFACMQIDGVTLETSTANKTCAAQKAGNYWAKLRTAVTDSTGAYDFIGLSTGTYIVEVGDTNSAPGTGNTSPYGGTQTAEGLDTQTVTGTNANGQTCGTCNNNWGWGAAESTLQNLNQLSAATEETINGVNFGYNNIAASLYGNVWHDIDGDAARDAGELGLSGFTVTLYSDANGNGVIDGADAPVSGKTTTSDASGNYSFTGLSALSYVIVVTPPTLRNKTWVETVETTGGTGSLNNQIPVTLSSGQVSGSHDFGYTKKDTASIGDTLFLDFNGNGVQDSTENGIANITVWLYKDVDRDGSIDVGVDDLVATTSTDASGKYLFSNLPAGSYVVKVDTSDTDFPKDVTPTADPDVNTGRIGDLVYFDANADGSPTRGPLAASTTNASTTVTSAGLFLATDVGARISGTGIPAGAIITGFTNASTVTISAAATATGATSVTLSDKGIPNVVVVLYEDTNNNGVLNVGTDKLVAAATTDTDGNYLFTGLHAGSYFVDIADDVADPNGNTLPSSALALVGTDPKNTLITLSTNSSSVLTADAGYSPSTNYAMGSRVWADANGNGVQDTGEAGIPNVGLSITNTTTRNVASNTTNGSTTVTSAALFLATDVGSRISGTGIPAGATITAFNSTSNVTISVAATATGAPTLTVSDYCYTSTPCSVTTDVAGQWMQSGLVSGRSYTVTVQTATLPRSHMATTPAGAPSNSKTITMPAADYMTADFGYRFNTDANLTTRDSGDPSGTVSGRVFLDLNANGAYDAGEARSGTTVNLLDENGYVVATTTTASDGTYYFGGSTTCTMTTTPACSGIAVGDYSVQAVDTLGTRYSAIFVSASTAFPNLNVIYNNTIETTADSQSSVSVDGIHADLMQDFGYKTFLGSIGDTVYWDANRNGTQDLSEPGIAGVSVRLYSCGWTDANSNGYFELGEETGCGSALFTTTTASDNPLTSANEGGTYLFTNLPSVGRSVISSTTSGSTTVTSNGLFSSSDVGSRISGSGIPAGATITGFTDSSHVAISAAATATATTQLHVGNYYLVVVDTASAPLSGATLTADPDTDGDSCPTLPNPDVLGDAYAPPAACDSAQLVRDFKAGLNYLGADFGYDRPPSASNGFIGDRVWIDQNNNGVVDAGERGIPNVRVYIDTGAAGFNWTDANGNGRWDAGEGDQWVWTDFDGNYLLTGLAASTTYTVKVDTTTLPASLPTTPVYEAGTASYDNSVTVALYASGQASITGSGCAANCNLTVDFGYRYAGSNALSGTVCVDDAAKNGYCGATATTYSGVGTGETALGGIQVNLYQWTDTDGDGVAWAAGGGLDPGDVFTPIATTTTNASGDYSFSNVPTGKIVVTMSLSDTQNLRLTTATAGSSVEGGTPAATTQAIYDGTTTYDSNTVTVIVRQALTIGTGTTQDLDFAFDPTLGGALTYDFGDLPSSYSATLLKNNGARHRTDATLFLGSGVTSEPDGQESPTATADTDDGVFLIGDIAPGPAPRPDTSDPQTGGMVQITMGGTATSGWVEGWMDFNNDGDFNDEGEHILSTPVFPGEPNDQRRWFDVPAWLPVSTTTLFARFRIYPEQPAAPSPVGDSFSLFSSSGSSRIAAAGEVEDYQFAVTVAATQAVVKSFVARDRRGDVAIEWETSSEVGTLGYFLRRWDAERQEWVQVNEKMLRALIHTRQGGHYSYIDRGAQRDITLYYQLVEIEITGSQKGYGPYAVNTATTFQADLARQTPDAFEPDHDSAGYAKLAHGRPPARKRTATQPPALPARYGAVQGAKMTVGETGLYYVSLNDLTVQGGLPKDRSWLVSARSPYGMSEGGASVAFAPAWDMSGIYFFGRAIDSPFARDNVYWLGAAAQGGVRMTSRKERPAVAPRGNETFTRSVHAEQDLMPMLGWFQNADVDYWMWSVVWDGYGPEWATFSTTFRADGAARSGNATLRVRLKGGDDLEGSPDNHRATVRLNGQEIGEVTWSGLDEVQPTFTFSGSLLQDGDNALEVVGDESRATWSLLFVDSFDVRYQSLYRATDNRLEFSAGGNPSVFVSGFTSRDIMVFDVTDPRLPVHVEAPVTQTPDGRFGISLAPPRPTVRYYAATPSSLRSVGRITPDAASSLASRDNKGEYLIITTAELKATAQKLADYRGDLVSQVIDIEDIYDEFNYGVPSPYAVRAFLSYARSTWNKPPRYVVLAGNGSFDYKDILGYGGNLVPPMVVSTPHWLFPSDTWFGDVDGTGPAPEVTIGRLPAANPAELDQLIRKIQMRESGAGSPWMSRTLVAADNPDHAGNFTADSERIAALAPPGSEVDRIYLGTTPIDEARARLIDGINEGAGMVSFVGHGGYDTFTDEGLFTQGDVEGLVNLDRPTILTALTCIGADFSWPGYPSMGDLLVRKAEGGAAAVWAPTGLSKNDYAVALGEKYYAAAFGPSRLRIGDAIRASMKAYEKSGFPAYMLSIYTLLGDPAMWVR